MSALAATLEKLTPEQRAVLELRLMKKRAAAARRPAIPRRARTERLPLSFAQQRLWLIDRLQPGSTAYNISLPLEVTGRLEVGALRRTFAQIVERHEILRTTFAEDAEGPVQVVAPRSGRGLALADLAGLPAEHRRRALASLRNREEGRPFDLSRGPLFRPLLLRLDAARWVLLLNLHHAVADGWSMNVLIREIGAIYGAFVAGKPTSLPELDIQYADFAIWQRGFLRGERLEKELDYWCRQLSDLPPALELPTDRPRPVRESARGALRPFSLREDLSARLKSLVQERVGLTLFMALQAGVQALLGRYTGVRQLTLGTAVANRNQPQVEGLIGFFVNTLVLRGDLSGNPRFDELLDRVREVTLSAYDHQDLPFELLVEALRPERHLDRTPFFQVFVQLQAGSRPAELPSLALKTLEGADKLAKFDLLLSLVDSPREVRGSWLYKMELFDASTLSRWSSHLLRLLESAAGDPGRRLSELTILSRAEWHQLHSEWTGRHVELAGSIHRAFEAWARRAPHAVAAVAGERRWSYAGLDARAARLARRLRTSGVGPESRVGLFLERGERTLVALVGILKAGGAYVPLDPVYPDERLRFMLQDCEVHVLLTETRLADRLPPSSSRVVVLDREEEWPVDADHLEPFPETVGTNLAYVMYTSGSTGRPKGVAVVHDGVLRLVAGADYAALGPGRTFFHFAPLAFDASTLEIWGPLLTGGCVVVQPAEQGSLEELGRAIRRHRVSGLWLTAGLFHQIEESGLRGFEGVERLLTGGDVVSPLHARRVLAALPGLVLVNGYGPTENTTFTACHPFAALSADGTLPIGRPVARTDVRVLDRRLEPVALGVPGELHAGGAGLARGYQNRPRLSAEKFIPDPVGALRGDRLYKTGDLVRWLADGNLDFLGRIDRQVKLRGFRIEPAEIEAALAGHAAVREAVVVTRSDPAGGKGLVAYVVAAEGRTADAADLRRTLERQLPAHMVPSVFVVLESIPLDANGKVDRRALPEPEKRSATAGEDPAPRDPVEEMLGDLWSDLLGVEPIGAADDFFELGGHSLLATRLVTRIRSVFGVELPLRRVFETPTLGALARAVEAARRDARGVAMPPLVPWPGAGPAPLSYAQQRLWFLYRLDPKSPAYNIPVALRAEGRFDVAVLEAALCEIVRRHETLRTRFGLKNGEPVQWVDPPFRPALPVMDLGGLDTADRERRAAILVAREAARPFDLAADPPLRVRIVRLTAREHVLLLNVHHIAADGWSMGVLVREMSVLHRAAREGRPSPLDPLPICYTDFAVWQREWLRGDALETEIAFWKGSLEGATRVLELPTDRPRPRVQTDRGARSAILLSAGLSRDLTALARRRGATRFMLLLAAFKALLRRYTGKRKIVVGTPIANRTRPETEGLIGFFVNTLALASDLGGRPSFTELLERVREVALDAFAHQDLPFEKLVEELSPARDTSRSPLFQVMFLLQHASRPLLELPGLALRSFEIPRRTSPFDWTLAAVDGERLSLALEYSADLFDASSIHRALRQLRSLLGALAADAELGIDEVPLLTAAESFQLRVAWNDSPASPEWDTALGSPSVLELFAAQAERVPEAVAVVREEENVSYGELARRASRLAHRLRELGAGPESVVGLLVERSPSMVTGLLGILAAGSCYLPLETHLPDDRVADLLADAGAQVLVTRRRLFAGLAKADLGAGPVWVDADARTATEGGAILEPPAPGQACYVIYTSGSTGRPKGVVVEHRCLAAFTTSAIEQYGIQATDRVLQFASPAFDTSAEEIYPTLARGATLVLRTDEMIATFAGFMAAARRLRLTVLDLPTSYWHELSAGGPPVPETVRTVIIGGEKAMPERLRMWVEKADPGQRLLNTYGPTEATVVATFDRLDGTRPARERSEVSIGRPLRHARAYVLERTLAPSPVGVPGELHLAGDGLARGYLGRSRPTAEGFVPNPFTERRGSRLYRTGDLARTLVDGRLEVLGRLDQQVKIRGFRVEPGEIESVLAEHPDVGRVAVVAFDEEAAGWRLAAYVAAASARAPDPEALRELARSKLPPYMVPGTFVVLDALPTTSGGKVDRRRLPAPKSWSGAGERPLVNPRDPLELRLLRIWEEVLGRSSISVTDDFFDLGGHSLLAVTLMSRIDSDFGRSLPLSALFGAPTIEGLARLLNQDGRPREVGPLVAVQPRGDRAPFYCVHPGGGGILSYLDLGRSLAPEQPLYALESPGLRSEEGGTFVSLEDMAADYVEAVRRHSPGPYLLGGWCVGGVVAFEMARQLSAQGQEVDDLVLLDSRPPPQRRRELDAAAMAAWFGWDLVGRHQSELPVSYEDFRRLDDEGRILRILETARRAGVLPPTAGTSRVRRMLEVFTNNIRTVWAYEPRPYPGRALVLRASEQPHPIEPSMGWHGLVTGPLESREVDGDHYSFLAPPRIGTVTQLLRKRFDARSGARMPVNRRGEPSCSSP